jgi:hypothetical protein
MSLVIILVLMATDASVHTLQDSATIQPDFTISYCIKQRKLAGSHTVKPYGEYTCIAFYLILKYYVDGLTMAANDQNM